MMTSSDIAAWGRRLRKEQPPNVHFIDPELLEPLAAVAAERGCTLNKLIKSILVEWLQEKTQ